MEFFGYPAINLAVDAAVSIVTALLAVVAWHTIEAQLRPREIAHEIVGTPQVATTPQATSAPLAQQRATILDSLHAGAAACEHSLRERLATSEEPLGDADISLACNGVLSNLRRKRPWLAPSTAEQADRVSASRDEIIERLAREGTTRNIDGLLKSIATLRERLESEFRACSGLFHATSKE